VPGGTPDPVTVRVETAVPFGGGVTLTGWKLHATSDGCPEHEKLTALLKPFSERTVHLLFFEKVPLTLRFKGLHVTLKSPGVASVTPTLIGAVRVSAPLVPTTLNV